MDRKGLAILVLAVLIMYLLFAPQGSRFLAKAGAVDGMNANEVSVSAPADIGESSTSGMSAVTAASLIPREVVQTEDFGQFSPENILSGQSYLDPRSQIGYPETIGGTLRNSNLQYRSEPVNPRTPVSIFNLSTISPDTMRPKFEIEPEYQ
jgi:hypothetical protein